MGMEGRGTFDVLNDALLAQMDRLMGTDGADPEALRLEVERTRAVSQLAANVNNNMGNAVRAAQLLAMEGADVSGLRATMPRMLGGGQDGV